MLRSVEYGHRLELMIQWPLFGGFVRRIGGRDPRQALTKVNGGKSRYSRDAWPSCSGQSNTSNDTQTQP